MVTKTDGTPKLLLEVGGATAAGVLVECASLAAAGLTALRDTPVAASERLSPRNSVRMRSANTVRKAAAKSAHASVYAKKLATAA